MRSAATLGREESILVARDCTRGAAGRHLDDELGLQTLPELENRDR